MDAIRDDKPFNEVKRGVDASVVTVMGRMAAHTGRTVTFDEFSTATTNSRQTSTSSPSTGPHRSCPTLRAVPRPTAGHCHGSRITWPVESKLRLGLGAYRGVLDPKVFFALNIEFWACFLGFFSSNLSDLDQDAVRNRLGCGQDWVRRGSRLLASGWFMHQRAARTFIAAKDRIDRQSQFIATFFAGRCALPSDLCLLGPHRAARRKSLSCNGL